MEKFKQELKQSNKFNSKYYDDLLGIIDTHIESKPDITIETCKSIIEGLSKLTLSELRQAPDGALRSNTVSKNYKDARNCLMDEWTNNIRITCGYDAEFMDKFASLANGIEQILNSEIVAYIGILRTGHGDISHGKSPFKEQVNDSDLAEMVVGITDSIATYMLRKLNQFTEDKVLYEDNPEFNLFLDEAIPLGDTVLYSKALFEQEPRIYEIQLGDYLLELNPEE